MYTLRLLGQASIEGPDGPLRGRAAQGRRLALVALLALARGRPISRDKLIALLWPEATPDRARPLLSDTLYILRAGLGIDAVRATGDYLTLDPDIVSCDVVQFEQALHLGRPSDAVVLYRGPVLDGFHVPDAAEFERWLDAERDAVERALDGALESLGDASEAAGDHRGAVNWWRRRAARDPVNAPIAQRLMRALDASGDRAGALRHAEIHASLLRGELDAAPDPDVAALAESLRRDTAPHALPASITRGEPAQEQATVADARERRPLAEPDVPAELPGTGARRRRGWIGKVALLMLLPAVAYVASRARASEIPRSVGVLPFVNRSADSASGYFSDGLSEQIILELSRIDGLRVAARTSSFALRDRQLGVRAIAETLGVQAVLEGTVFMDHGRLRVIAQLIDARTGYHLWSNRYDSDLGDAFAVQDSVADAIARALQLRLAGRKVTSAARTPSPEAYDLYLRGLYLRNTLQPEALREASAYFDRAIAREPAFARAWAAKASVTAPMAYFGYADRDSVVEELRRYTARALELEPASSEAHTAAGIVRFFFEWDWPGAHASLRRAVELNPSDAHAWHHLANYHSAMRDEREATEARETALRLDPLNPRALALSARQAFFVGDTGRALELARRAARLDPAHPLLLGTGPGQPVGLPELLLRQGRRDEALEEYLRVATLRGATAREVEGLRRAYLESGVEGFWKRWLQMDLRLAPSPDPMRMATLHALGGDTAQSLDWLERAHAERNPGLVYIRREPALDLLHGQARYRRIVEAMKLPR